MLALSLQVYAEELTAERAARQEAERQLRETLEVMEMLKECLEGQKEQVVSLERQIENLRLQQRWQQQQQKAGPNGAPSAAILDALAKEAEGEEVELDQRKISVTTQTHRLPGRDHAEAATPPVKVT